MSGIVLQTKAFKLSNKGGGVRQVDGRKVRNDGNRHHLFVSGDSGSDYVHFICPKCAHRNKCSMYEAENYIPASQNVIPFKCRICRITVEVEPPAKPMKQESLLVTPEQFTAEMAKRRRDLTGNSKLVRP